MSNNIVQCAAIDKARRDQYLDTGYNAPMFTDTFQRHDYADEWYQVFESVKFAVERNWRHGYEDNTDFFMPSDLEMDRFLSIEVSNEKMIGQQLLKTVQDTLREIDVEYSVDVCNAWGYVDTDFNIFIEKNRILVYSESKSMLERLGATSGN